MSTTKTALAVAMQARIPTVVMGPPGGGKTSYINSMAVALGVHCETIIASIREPSDFGGLPIVENGHGVRFEAPQWARNLDEKGGICFIDEISTAPPAVQAALLRVLLEAVVGDLKLDPTKVSFLAAANPPEQAAGGWDFSPPLANRLCHLQWDLVTDEWTDGMQNGWPAPSIPMLPKTWEKGIPQARALVSSFIKARPNLLLAVPDNEDEQGKAWPSPRTWDMAARASAAADSIGSTDAKNALIIGCVGEGAGLEYLTWVRDMDLPDPEMLLAKPEKFDAVKLGQRGDRLYAVMTAVAIAFSQKPTKKRWDAAVSILAKAGEHKPDIAASSAKLIANNRPEGVTIPKSIGEIFGPLLQKVGFIK